MLDGWANASIPSGLNYRNVVAIQAAISDFPRVRGHLNSRLKNAEQALAAFEDENGLR
jgi:hypothetical protein